MTNNDASNSGEEQARDSSTEAEEAEARAQAAAAEGEAAANENGEAESAEEALSELEQARREASEFKNRYYRAVADLENFRKRISREKQETIRSAAAGVIEDLLPVLDNMKLGLQAAENNPQAQDVAQGFQMVHNQLKQVLEQHGLEEVTPDGEAFDPNHHECIAHKPSDEVPENHVRETVRSGYQLNERLVRPANVVVSSGAGGVDSDAEGPAEGEAGGQAEQ